MEPLKCRNIVFIDFISVGHHGTYLKGFIQAVAESGHHVTIFYPDKNDIDTWIKSHLSPYRESIVVHEIPEISIHEENRFIVLRRWMLTQQLIQRKKLIPDLVFFTWVDDFRFRKDHLLLDRLFLRWIERLFPYKWSGLYFHPVHLRITDNHVTDFPGYDIDDVFKLKNCTSVCLLDKEVRKKLADKIHKPVITFPDFTDDIIDHSSITAANVVKASQGRKIILLIGALMKRKGIFTFLEAAKLSSEKPWLFVLAGKIFRENFSESELAMIDEYTSNSPANVFFVHDHIREQDFNALVNACDILYAAYYDFPHTSNMLNKASIFHKPLIVSKGFYMDEVVTSLKIGEVIDKANPQAAMDAIKKILESENYITEETLQGFENYRRENSTAKLTEAFEQVLQAANP